MCTKYVLAHHKREIFQKFQSLTQGEKSVDEYYRDIELAMMRANVDEDDEATMAQFMGGFNREIAHLVELHNYETIDDIVQMAEKVEKQLKRRPQGNRANSGTPSSWKNTPNSRPP